MKKSLTIAFIILSSLSMQAVARDTPRHPQRKAEATDPAELKGRRPDGQSRMDLLINRSDRIGRAMEGSVCKC